MVVMSPDHNVFVRRTGFIAGHVAHRRVIPLNVYTELCRLGYWMSEAGKQKLKGYGIAPPAQKVIDISGISRKGRQEPAVACPHCGSSNTRVASQFGSTACKALYTCADCLEPFDYFKCH